MNSVCYLNPVQLAVPAIFPDFNAYTNTLSWIITANYSSLVNHAYFTSILIQWQSSDPVLGY